MHCTAHCRRTGSSKSFSMPAQRRSAAGRKADFNAFWTISTTPVTTYAGRPCSAPLDAMLPEGTFPLQLAVKDTKTSVTKTVSSSITVRNTLVSILGDSYASGEGLPAVPQPRRDDRLG